MCMCLKKSVLSIFILFICLYLSYDYGHSMGYNDGYFEGYIDGYLTNKYITHDYANFSAENAVNEKIKFESTRGKNMSEANKIWDNT